MPALAKASITSAIPDSIKMAFGYLSMKTALTSSRSSCVGVTPSRRRRIEDRRATHNRVDDHLHAIAATRPMQRTPVSHLPGECSRRRRCSRDARQRCNGANSPTPLSSNDGSAGSRITDRHDALAAIGCSCGQQQNQGCFGSHNARIAGEVVVCVAAPVEKLTCTNS